MGTILDPDEMGKTYLVCCLDILGYKEFISDSTSEISQRNAISGLYAQIEQVLSLWEKNSSDEYSKTVLAETRIQIISDSIIIAWDLNNVSHDSKKCLDIFFRIVSGYFVMFPQRVGYFLRGGIELGRYYQTQIGENARNQFIFSKALNGAHELAEKRADWPRVILSDDVIKFIKQVFYKFQVGDFEESLEKIRPLLEKLGQSIINFKNIEGAVEWLNSSIEPFKIYVRYIENNPIEENIGKSIPLDFQSLSESQFGEFAQISEGQKLKREILNQLYPQDAPKPRCAWGQVEDWVFQDSDKQYCLNSYLFFQSSLIDYLSQIKSIVEKQVLEHKDNPKILGKYCLFAQYHNKSVRKLNKKPLEDFIISIDVACNDDRKINEGVSLWNLLRKI